MTTSFYSIANRSGIACASDSDHTIYNLSKEEPLAVAVNPFSSIPWYDIIEDYRRKGEPEHHEDFKDYVKDFAKHLVGYDVRGELNDLAEDDRNIIFLGYGAKNLYPCVYDTHVNITKDNKVFTLENGYFLKISNKCQTLQNYIGDFDCLNPILAGTTRDMYEKISNKSLEMFKLYENRVIEKFAGSEYETRVKEAIANYDSKIFISMRQDNSSSNIRERVSIGLDSFGMEELVSTCENFIYAANRLNHLKSGGQNQRKWVKEIAVITRAEGLTWIRHSLFAK